MNRTAKEPPSREERRRSRGRDAPGKQIESVEQQSIREWLKKVRFRKTIFGGLQEADVWKKMAEFNTMYEAALTAERMRYDTLLKEQVPILAQRRANQMVNQMYQRSARQENGENGQYK